MQEPYKKKKKNQQLPALEDVHYRPDSEIPVGNSPSLIGDISSGFLRPEERVQSLFLARDNYLMWFFTG